MFIKIETSEKSFIIIPEIKFFTCIENIDLPLKDNIQDVETYRLKNNRAVFREGHKHFEGSYSRKAYTEKVFYIKGEKPLTYVEFDSQEITYTIFTQRACYLCTEDGRTNTTINR